MITSPTSGSDRQGARNKGLARISALTLGAGAAGLVGAAAIALTLPSPTSATNANGTTVASNTFTNGSDDDPGSQLQSGTPPATSFLPPVATSGAS
jgi:hypothetical protein